MMKMVSMIRNGMAKESRHTQLLRMRDRKEGEPSAACEPFFRTVRPAFMFCANFICRYTSGVLIIGRIKELIILITFIL